MSIQFITAAEAASLIPDESTVAVDGFIGFALPDDILGEIENRFLEEGHPKNLSSSTWRDWW